MDDDETRRLILRLQMEDLASIWASSTTSADDDNDLDADVSLRLYRHELRTADQQIDDRISARAAADDELRQRNAIRADRQEARRLFQQLNPDEPVPELSEAGQLLLTDHPDTCNAPVKDETSSTLGHLQHPDTPTMRASPSLPSRQTIAPTSSVKRSADHLDTIADPPPKKQAIEELRAVPRPFSACWPSSSDRAPGKFINETSVNPSGDAPAQIPLCPPSASSNLKRPTQDGDTVALPAKRPNLMLEADRSDLAQSADVHHRVSVTSAETPAGEPEFDHVFEDTLGRGHALRDDPELSGSSNELKGLAASPDSGLISISDSGAPPEAPASKPLDASRQPVPPAQQAGLKLDDSLIVECLVCCRERERSRTYVNSCGHFYCQKCVNRLFRKSLHDETLWPPQCCGTAMSFENVRHLLKADVEPKLKFREIEMSTPPLERVYCANCSTFIPKDYIHGKRAICLACSTTTCTDCTRTDHAGECQEDVEQAKKQLEALAAGEGWKTCSKCHIFVEHNTGCNHMTYRCKHEFCYQCVKKWKECHCDWWDEDLLLEREEQRGVADVGIDVCRHGDWIQYEAKDNCDNCGDLMPNYLFSCPGCLVQFCRWCTYNRGFGVF